MSKEDLTPEQEDLISEGEPIGIITNKKFRNKETGEIVERFSILEIKKYEEIKEDE